MRSSVNTFPVTPLPAALSVDRLEMLIRAARHHGHTFRISRAQGADFRYFVTQGCPPASRVIMMTNDISDVAAYLGVDGFVSDVHELGPGARPGLWLNCPGADQPVPLEQQRPQPLPVFKQASMPVALRRDSQGVLVPHSEEIKCRAEALYALGNYTMFDCRRALVQTDGDTDKAMALLESTDGFARSKI
jgi:hypothetical protein